MANLKNHLCGLLLLLCHLHYMETKVMDQDHDVEHLSLHLGDRLDFDEEGARHIYEHMSQMIDLPENVKQGEFTDEEGRFYFFVSHDFDGNNKLDGLECFALLTDFYDTKDPKAANQLAGKMSAREVETLVDDLLVKHDANRDGYLDFAELNGGNVVSIWTRMTDIIDDVEQRMGQGDSPSAPKAQPPSQSGQAHHQPAPPVQQQQAVHHQQQPVPQQATLQQQQQQQRQMQQQVPQQNIQQQQVHQQQQNIQQQQVHQQQQQQQGQHQGQHTQPQQVQQQTQQQHHTQQQATQHQQLNPNIQQQHQQQVLQQQQQIKQQIHQQQQQANQQFQQQQQLHHQQQQIHHQQMQQPLPTP